MNKETSLSLSSVWKRAWATWKKHALPFAALGGGAYIVDLALRYAGFITDNPESAKDIVATLVAAVVALIAYLCMMVIMRDEQDIKTSLKESIRLTPHYLLLDILIGLVVLAGFILLIIPGFIVIIYVSMASFVFVWERKRGLDAIELSWWRVRGSWWTVLGHVLVLLVGVLIIFSLFGALAAAILGMSALAGEIGSAIVSVILFPLILSYLSTVYHSLYARTHGSLPDEAGSRARRRWLVQLPAIAIVIIALFLWFVFK